MFLTSAGLPSFALADDTEPPLEKLTILGDRSPLYRTEDVQVGPLADRALVDTPYSMSPEAQHVIGMYGFTPVAEHRTAP